jgi:hypothetical protein
MNLNQAKSVINDGDIISVLKVPSSKIVDKLISFWEQSPIFHTFLAVWIDGELHALQMDPNSQNIVTIENYAINPLHVLQKPKEIKIDKSDLIRNVSHISYSLYGAVTAGIEQYFDYVPFIKQKQSNFCSQYVAEVWNKGGFKPQIKEDLDPYELELFLLTHNIQKIEINP